MHTSTRTERGLIGLACTWALMAGGCMLPSGNGEGSEPRAALPDGYEVVGDQLMFEGDIIVGPADEWLGPDGELLVPKGAGQFNASSGYQEPGVGRPWPGGVIPFKFESGFPASLRTRVQEAQVELLQKTSIFLFESPTATGNHIVFKQIPADGKICGSSSRGMVGGAQAVNLIADAERSCVLHELGHAIGLMHEHQRWDAGLTVSGSDVGRLSAQQQANFLPATFAHRGVTPYDDQSLMHYSSPQISCLAADPDTSECIDESDLVFVDDDGDDVIVPDAPTFSYRDLQAIQVMYGDQFEPTLSVPVTRNEGGAFPAAYRGVFFRTDSDTVVHTYWTGKRWTSVDLDGLHALHAPAITESSEGNLYAYGSAINISRLRIDPTYDYGAEEWLHVPSTVEDRGYPEYGTCPAPCPAIGTPTAVGGDLFVKGGYGGVINWNLSGWRDLGGLAKDPMVAVRTGYVTHLLAVGWDYNLFHKSRATGGAEWEPGPLTWDMVPGIVKGRPSAVSCDDEHIEVVVKGLDSAAFYQVFDGNDWAPQWLPLGGLVVGNPEAVCSQGALVTFARSGDGNLYYKVGYGVAGQRVFGSWVSLGAPTIGFVGAPAVAADDDGIEIFVRGSDDRVWNRRATWNWFSLQAGPWVQIGPDKAAW